MQRFFFFWLPILIVAFLLLTSFYVEAHPGRLAADGCHTESATGIRHDKDGNPCGEQPAEPVIQPPVQPPGLPDFDEAVRVQIFINVEAADGSVTSHELKLCQ